MEELEHALRVLIEIDLYRRIRAIREGLFPNEGEMISEAIQSFENTLPENLQKVPNKHEIIIDTINRAEKNAEEIKRMREQEGQER